MLVISTEQMTSFTDVSVLSFENQMVVHLNEFARRHCEVIGEDCVREVIRLGIKQSAKYGFTNQGPVQLYLELMFMFGSYFDTDPQMQWAIDVLNKKNVDEQMVRANKLFESTNHYMKVVLGSKNEHTYRALKNIRTMAGQPITFDSSHLISGLLESMYHAYPQKFEDVGREVLEELLIESANFAKEHDLNTFRGKMLYGILVFALGRGFSHDPLYPWISRTLRDTAIIDHERRVEKLEKRVLLYLDSVLIYLRERDV